MGFVNSATGVSAAPNESIVGSTMGAVDQINGAGGIDGKIMIELISKDDGSDVAKASAAVTQLIQQDKVDFILQPWVDFIAPVARGIEEKAGMPGVLSYSPQKGKETEAFKWTFSNAQGAKDNADALVKVFSAQGWKNVVGAADVLTIQQETLDYVDRDGSRRRYHVHQAQRSVAARPDGLQRCRRPRSSRPVTKPTPTRSASW